MRLAIADPPYLGRAAIWYGAGMTPDKLSPEFGGRARIGGVRPADNHPEAARWDDPEAHHELVASLVERYRRRPLRRQRARCPVRSLRASSTSGAHREA